VTGIEVGLERSVNRDREEVGPEPPVTDLFDPDPYAPWNGEIVHTGERTEADAQTAAAYVFDTVDVGNRWQLSGGLRWDRFDLDFVSPDFSEERVDEKTSWRAGVVYKPAANGSLYASAGTSFNPSAEGLSLRSREADLEPERSRSYEVGTKWELLSSRLGVAAAVFRTEKANAQTPGIDPGDPPTVLDGEQRVQGAELSVDGRLGERWSFAGTYTYMESEIEASNRPEEIGAALANTPEHSASAWATWSARGGFQVAGGAAYVGDRASNNRGNRTAPEYLRWDAALSHPVGERLSLRLNVRNLTDERYIERVGGGHFIPGPGRSVALTTALTF
jgi:catecholate siderophore receptor